MQAGQQRCGRELQGGFTLLELAIVLVVLSLITGSFIDPLGEHLESRRRQQTAQLLEYTRQAVIGFAAAHARLPCPALIDGPAIEQQDCTDNSVGVVPAVTLGMQGSIDEHGRLLDAWGQPLRYAVTSADHAERGRVGEPDFLTPAEMSLVGMQHLKPDLTICREHSGSHCTQSKMVASQVPLVIYSLGKDDSVSGHQAGNQDLNKVFVTREFSKNEQQPFDDMVVWLSEHVLFYHLLQAGVLP